MTEPVESLAFAVILTAIEDYFMEVPKNGKAEDIQAVEANRRSAAVFFNGNESESNYRSLAMILEVPALSPEQIAENIKTSGRKFGGRIKKSAMREIIGNW